MVGTCVDSALLMLAQLELDPSLTPYVKNQVQNLQVELKFLKMLFWSFAKCSEADKDIQFRSVLSNMEAALKEAVTGHQDQGESFCKGSKRSWKPENWDILGSKLIEKVEHFKLETKEICLDLLQCSSLQSMPSESDEILEYFDLIRDNLKDLGRFRADLLVPVKQQFVALEEKLILIGNVVEFTARRCVSSKILRHFMIHIQGWANKAACLSFLYWVNNMEEEMVTSMGEMLLDLLEKIRPCHPEAIRMYLGVLRASKITSRSDSLLMGRVVASFVDNLLVNLLVPMKDAMRSLRDGLIILITFLMDPAKECGADGKRIRMTVDDVVNGAPSIISSLCVSDLQDGIHTGSSTLLDFLEEISIVKAEVGERYVQMQDMSWSYFPRTNALGSIDFLLGRIEDMLKYKASSILFAKHQIETIKEKLVSLRPFLDDIVKLQNEIEEVKDTWTRIISLIYGTEHAIDSCFFADDPIWYKMICLSHVIEEIDLMMTEVKKTGDKHMHDNITELCAEINSSCSIPALAKTSRISEVVVGFEKEAETIVDQLKRGSEQLDIVSIIGMPGQGKTTLANKVYNDPSVKCYFNKKAWCSVSQVYNRRMLFLDILSDITVLNDEIPNMKDEDLAEKLYKCLKGQRYLIVMDDIWDIKAWHELREPFPNDNNGSRIMFTSRIHNVALQANHNSNPYVLCPLSVEESWELLEKKIFHDAKCPPYLSEVGKHIAMNCKGLPLSIVVIAGVLAGKARNLDWWKHIAESLSSHIASEGCMEVLELSYKHLPDILKPCFLYFGAFQEDEAIKVRKLTQLWVTEGFIPRTGTKRLEDLANEYLMNLIDRSLVIVASQSSNGGIKACRVHDLLRDLCLLRVRQESFLRVLNASQYSSNMKYEHYRLCIHTAWKPFVESEPRASRVRSLLFPKFNRHPYAPSFFMRFKFLRVLDMEDVESLDGFPEEIISLVHLRYLALKGIADIPSSIDNLCNLEVLLVRSVRSLFWVPNSIWKMKKLRHLNIRRFARFTLDDFELADSPQLDNVETFSSPLFYDTRNAEKLLRRFPEVRKLRFQISLSHRQPRNSRRMSNKFPALDFLSKLESLYVDCTGGLPYPSAFSFPSTLKKLTLSKSRLPWSEISALGKLQNLEILKLLQDAFVGQRWDMEDEEFLNLKYLKLESSNIVEWNSCSDPFPCLQRLVVVNCSKLEEIPSCFGDIPPLKMIEVRSCSHGAESSARQILSDQLDMGNEHLEVLVISHLHSDDGSM